MPDAPEYAVGMAAAPEESDAFDESEHQHRGNEQVGQVQDRRQTPCLCRRGPGLGDAGMELPGHQQGVARAHGDGGQACAGDTAARGGLARVQPGIGHRRAVGGCWHESSLRVVLQRKDRIHPVPPCTDNAAGSGLFRPEV